MPSGSALRRRATFGTLDTLPKVQTSRISGMISGFRDVCFTMKCLVAADLFFHDAPVRHLLRVRGFETPLYHLAGGLHQLRCAILRAGEAAAHQFRNAFYHSPCVY